MHTLQNICSLQVQNLCFGNSFQPVKVQRISVRRHLAIDGHLNQPLPRPPSLGDYHRRVGWNIVKTRGQGWPHHIFWTWPNHHTHEFTVSVIAHTSPAQKQANQHSSMEEEGLTFPHMQLRSYWQLMASGGREGQRSLWVWPLVGSSCTVEWPHSHKYLSSTKWTQWVIKRHGDRERQSDRKTETERTSNWECWGARG